MKKLVLSLFLAIASISLAQTTGKISYSMEFSSENPEMAMAIGMMQGSKMDLSFMPGKSRLDMSMGSMMKMTTISVVKSDATLMMMEVMGQKIATESKISNSSKDESATKPAVEKTEETKDIIGYKCQKYLVKTDDGVELVMWATKDITATLAGQKQFGNSVVEGVPLEFSTISNGMNIHFVATKFDKAVDKKGFSTKVPQGYTVMSEDDLRNMGGGM